MKRRKENPKNETRRKNAYAIPGENGPVRIIAVMDYGVECEFLADLPPVRSGDLTIAGTANLFPIEKSRKKNPK